MRTIINLFLILFIISNAEASLDASLLSGEKIINILKRDCSLEYQVRSSSKEVKNNYKQNMHYAILKVASMLSRLSIPIDLSQIVILTDSDEKSRDKHFTKERCSLVDKTPVDQKETGSIALPRLTPSDNIYELHEYAINLMDLPNEMCKYKESISPIYSLQYVMRDLIARLYFATRQDRALSYLIFKPKELYKNGLWFFYNNKYAAYPNDISTPLSYFLKKSDGIYDLDYQNNEFDLGDMNGFWRSVYTIDYVTKPQLNLITALLIPGTQKNKKQISMIFSNTPTSNSIGVTSETMKIIDSNNLIVSNCFEIKENIPEIPQEDISMKIINLYDEYEDTKSKDNPKCIIN